MDNDKRHQQPPSGFAAWEEERRSELREKARRGEELTHSERLDLALEGVSP